jgi:hypothetical protein
MLPKQSYFTLYPRASRQAPHVFLNVSFAPASWASMHHFGLPTHEYCQATEAIL